MKKHTLAAWAAATLLLLSACTGSGENHTTPPAVQPEDQTQGDTLPSDGEGEEFPVYYGTWTVTGVQAYCAISALGPEEAEAKAGSTVTYGAAAFDAPGEESCEGPVYTEAVTTAETLAAEFQVNSGDLGLPEGEVQTLSVDNGSGLGRFAIVKDAENMILYLDGVWFAAEKVE